LRNKCLATDVVFTHELSLYGEFIQVPEQLFFYYGRPRRNTPAEEYAILHPGNKLPGWYLPFAVLAANHARSIYRSPLTLVHKIFLIGFLTLHEAKMVCAKMALRFFAKVFFLPCPHWIRRIVDGAMHHNPNIRWRADEASIPWQHQAPSKRILRQTGP